MNHFDEMLAPFGTAARTLSIVTDCCEQTEAFGAALARRLLRDRTLPLYIALRGDLGVGKTAFVRGFVAEIAPGAAVRSPTFSLVNEYRPNQDGFPLVFHFDMYRITDEDDLYSIGYDDYPDRGICLVEWSENILYALPDTYLALTIVKSNSEKTDERTLSLELV